MVEPARRRATYEDLLSVPDHLVAEIVDGALHTFPRPAPPHALATSAAGSDLFASFHGSPGGRTPGGWWILDEPELHLQQDVLVPDIAGWRRARMPSLPREAHFSLAPDWVCEVLSERTASFDRVAKMRIYLREEVHHVWLVDPVARTLEIYRHAGANWALLASHAGGEKLRAEPFADIEIDLGRWWVPDEGSPTNP